MGALSSWMLGVRVGREPISVPGAGRGWPLQLPARIHLCLPWLWVVWVKSSSYHLVGSGLLALPRLSPWLWDGWESPSCSSGFPGETEPGDISDNGERRLLGRIDLRHSEGWEGLWFVVLKLGAQERWWCGASPNQQVWTSGTGSGSLVWVQRPRTRSAGAWGQEEMDAPSQTFLFQAGPQQTGWWGPAFSWLCQLTSSEAVLVYRHEIWGSRLERKEKCGFNLVEFISRN